MKAVNENLITQLNSLVEINNDRIEGYYRAARETDQSDLKSLFDTMAAHSQKFKTELANEITRLGGKPTEGTRNSGKIFRAWMDIKAALTGKDRKAIISSCEFGEDAALEAYEDVLKSDALTSESSLRWMVSQQKQELQHDHDKIKALRDSKGSVASEL